MLERPPCCFNPGYMMLMREGDGEGALEENVLELREAAVPTSQCCNSSRSSALEGPPSVSSKKDGKGKNKIYS